MRELEGLGGFTMYIGTTREDVMWVNNFIPGLNPLNAADRTWLEVNGRKRALITHRFLKEHEDPFRCPMLMDPAHWRCEKHRIQERKNKSIDAVDPLLVAAKTPDGAMQGNAFS